MVEPGRLQSMGSLRVQHDWETSLSLITFMHWRRKWQLTPVFLLGESQGRGSLVGCCLWDHTVAHDWSDLAAAAELLFIPITILKLQSYSHPPLVLIVCCLNESKYITMSQYASNHFDNISWKYHLFPW